MLYLITKEKPIGDICWAVVVRPMSAILWLREYAGADPTCLEFRVNDHGLGPREISVDLGEVVDESQLLSEYSKFSDWVTEDNMEEERQRKGKEAKDGQPEAH